MCGVSQGCVLCPDLSSLYSEITINAYRIKGTGHNAMVNKLEIHWLHYIDCRKLWRLATITRHYWSRKQKEKVEIEQKKCRSNGCQIKIFMKNKLKQKDQFK